MSSTRAPWPCIAFGPPASSTAELTASVVVPTPPFGEKKVTILPAPLPAAPSGRALPVRIRSASTRASSSVEAKLAAITSSAPASRKAMRASTSPAGETTISGTCFVVAPRMRAIAPETASPSAMIRSNGSTRSALTASAAVSTAVVT